MSEKFFCQINIRSKSGDQKISMILVNKVLQKLKFSKNVNNKKPSLKLRFLIKKKLKKIWIIFEIEN